MSICTPAPNATRNGTGTWSDGSSPASLMPPPPETRPGVPDRLLRKPDAERVFEARVRWFLDVSHNA